MIAWSRAVKKLGVVHPDERPAYAKKLLPDIHEADRALALVRALVREAHMADRRSARGHEFKAASKGLRATIPKDVSERLRRDLGPVLQVYREELHIEWSTELLGTAFSLRDGLLVTWGAATIAEHKERIDMFMDQAAANTDGAAKHSKAIRAIEDAGVQCLNDAVEQAA